ncbi:hypothetical protein D3C86_1715350 [compost metagenome]
MGDCLIHQGRQGIDLADVGLEAQEAAADGFDLGDGLGRLDYVDADDVTARLGEPQRHALAQTGIATGDDGDLTFQIKCIKNHIITSKPTGRCGVTCHC